MSQATPATKSSAGPEAAQICREFEAPGLRTFGSAEPLALKAARGWTATGVDCTEYIDLGGMNGVANIGHAHPEVVEAIRRQAGELIHCPTGHPSPARADFYAALHGILPEGLDVIFPNLTGAGANETAILLARAYRPKGQILCFTGGYHGRSIGTVGLAGKSHYRDALGLPATAQFVPFPDPDRFGPDCLAATMATLTALASAGGGVEGIAAVLVEPVEGNCGVIVPPTGFLKALRAFCDATGALLICDEIQSGGGRTGRMFAFEHEGIVPDILTAGKAIGGGMPVSVTVARRALAQWAPDTVAGTFIVNNVGLAAATAAINVLVSEGLAERSARVGATALARLRDGLAGCPAIGAVRGKGLWLAIQMRGEDEAQSAAMAKAIVKGLRARNIIGAGGGYAGEVVKIAPALNIPEDVLFTAIDSWIEVVRDVTREAAA